MPILWTTNFNLGIRSIDLQHQELVEMINELEALTLTQTYGQSLAQLLMRLHQYVLFHFHHEEEWMAQMPMAEELRSRHLGQHAEFSHQLAARVEEVQAGGEQSAVIALHAYLKSWLMGHIQHVDAEMVKSVRLRSISPGPQAAAN